MVGPLDKSDIVDSQRNQRRLGLSRSLAPASSPAAALLGEYIVVYAQLSPLISAKTS